jgi:hypothetical protein
VIFADVGPGEYEVTGTFMQGKNVKSLPPVQVVVGEPRKQAQTQPWLNPTVASRVLNRLRLMT